MSPRALRGFTLLEMMLVILLIGITAGIVVSTLPDRDRDDARRQSQRLTQNLQWLSEQAVSRGQYYGLHITRDSWQWMVQKTTDDHRVIWQPLSSKEGRLVAEQKLPDGFTLSLQLDQLPADLSAAGERNANMPQIWLFPGGEIVPFHLRFLGPDQQPQVEVQADTEGQIHWIDSRLIPANPTRPSS